MILQIYNIIFFHLYYLDVLLLLFLINYPEEYMIKLKLEVALYDN